MKLAIHGLSTILILTFFSCASSSRAQKDSAEPTAGERLNIQRSYSEDVMINIFEGRSAVPQSRGLEKIIGQCIDILTSDRSGLHQSVGKLERDLRKQKDGFDIGVIPFAHEKVTGEFRVSSGIYGRFHDIKRLKFAEVEQYLSDQILKPHGGRSAFAVGAFTNKPLGEAAWHRVDENTREFEIVWLRGLTIVQIRATLKEGDSKSFAEKMDAAAQKLDDLILSRMYSGVVR